MTEPHVLVVDDDRTIREALASTLMEAGYRVSTADGLAAARARLAEGELPTAVLLDVWLGDGDGLELLAELRHAHPDLAVIMATAFGDGERTIHAMKLGAFDYVTKPFDLDALLASVARAVRAPAVARVAERGAEDARFIGSSPAMLEVWKAIGRASTSRAAVLILGESGVGKELVARSIHAHGPQRSGPFVAVNLAALPAALVESELFGHERGAFTGAAARRDGRFTQAAGGTLFLDEIGDLEPGLQTKLLRVLEDGGFERVGSGERLGSTARIVAATSRPVRPGEPGATLREDLYYRLGVLRIEVPPLRARRQDIPLLVDAFLRGLAPLEGAPSGRRRAISEPALARLVAHDWPGNVRQLRHAIEQASVMSAAEVLDVDDFRALGPVARVRRETETPPESELDEDLDLRRTLERVERRLIARALERAAGNRAQAARLLGIRRALLYARMKYLGLGRGDEDDGAE